MKRFLKVIGAYLLSGAVYASIFMLTGGTKLDLGLGSLGNILIFLLIMLLWPLVIFWKIESNGFHLLDIVPIALLLILLFFIYYNKGRDRVKTALAEKNQH